MTDQQYVVFERPFRERAGPILRSLADKLTEAGYGPMQMIFIDLDTDRGHDKSSTRLMCMTQALLRFGPALHRMSIQAPSRMARMTRRIHLPPITDKGQLHHEHHRATPGCR